MKHKILFLLLAIVSLQATAQEPKKNRFEIEVDPIAFGLNGYSFHGIFVHKKWRFDAGVFGLTQPESFSGNKGFEVKSNGFGVKVNYLLNKKETWFAGVDAGYAFHKATHKESKVSDKGQTIGIGVHTGYRFFLSRKNWLQKVYLAPWVSFGYEVPVENIRFKQVEYKEKRWTVFPTIHIGYKL